MGIQLLTFRHFEEGGERSYPFFGAVWMPKKQRKNQDLEKSLSHICTPTKQLEIFATEGGAGTADRRNDR